MLTTIRFYGVRWSLAVLLTGSCFAAERPLTGAYRNVTIDRDVQSAAEFAVRARAKSESEALKLKAIAGARMQIVAGRNYQLSLVVQSGTSTRNADAVVFQALNSSNKLTSWRWTSRAR